MPTLAMGKIYEQLLKADFSSTTILFFMYNFVSSCFTHTHTQNLKYNKSEAFEVQNAPNIFLECGMGKAEVVLRTEISFKFVIKLFLYQMLPILS